MPGAITLAAKAAMRTGAGAVTIATWPEHAKGALPLIPEAMVWGVLFSKRFTAFIISSYSMCSWPWASRDSDWAVELYSQPAITSQLPHGY